MLFYLFYSFSSLAILIRKVCCCKNMSIYVVMDKYVDGNLRQYEENYDVSVSENEM